MRSTLFTAIFLFAVSGLSAPVGDTLPTRTLNTRNATAPAPFSQTTIVFPDLQVRWKSKEPDTKATNTKTGHLLHSRYEQVQTAVYFDLSRLSPDVAGKTCRLVFRLSENDWTRNDFFDRPAVFDIYRLDGCLNEGYSWNNPLARGIHAGIVTPKKGGVADWQGVDMSTDWTDPIMGAAPQFPCRATEYSFEMVGQAGSNIGWDSSTGSGLSIEICG